MKNTINIGESDIGQDIKFVFKPEDETYCSKQPDKPLTISVTSLSGCLRPKHSYLSARVCFYDKNDKPIYPHRVCQSPPLFTKICASTPMASYETSCHEKEKLEAFFTRVSEHAERPSVLVSAGQSSLLDLELVLTPKGLSQTWIPLFALSDQTVTFSLHLNPDAFPTGGYFVMSNIEYVAYISILTPSRIIEFIEKAQNGSDNILVKDVTTKDPTKMQHLLAVG